jgi:thiopeptide-type bacteriocin biosynthesis protein
VTARRAGLYAPLGPVFLRAPVLPAGARRTAGAATSNETLLPDDPRVRAAVSLASTDLAAALARTHPGHPDALRLRSKLLRYVIRMSTRPTPFGLFAGVAVAEWGEATDLAIAPGTPRTRTRLDMALLLEFVASLEEEPAIRGALRVFANSAIVVGGPRAFVKQTGGETAAVRFTAPVRHALEHARRPIAQGELCAAVEAATRAPPPKVRRLVEELCDQELLLLDLRPPLTAGDPAAYVLDRLAEVPAAAEARARLARARAALEAWDALPLTERADRLPAVLDLARALSPDPGASRPVVQTDMALNLAGAHVHRAIAAEAARAAELLLRLTPQPRGVPRLDAYRRAFVARYGADRMVPLLELVDEELGLGDPNGVAAARPSPGRPAAGRREQALRELALGALRDRRHVVDLDDELLGRLETWAPSPADAPVSLELSLFVAAASRDAIDAGDFRVVVGPNLGARAAGRSIGRFADLLPEPAGEALSAIAAAEAATANGSILAEVVYAPPRARSANVALRPNVRGWEIAFSTPPGVPGERVIPLDELVVGVRDDRFTVGWPAAGAEVVGVQGHMLNTSQAPAAARFLLDAAEEGRPRLSSLDWGAAAAFPFLPRVQRGRIVLALARWRVDADTVDAARGAPAAFAEALGAWRRRWTVPGDVYLAAGDNRLLLDLEDPQHVELLRQELRSLPSGRPAFLQEALPGPGDAWLPGPDGGHVCELVVPLVLRRRAGAPESTDGAVRVGVPSAVRLRPPGSDWLYLQLHGPRSFEDELIAGPLRALGESVTAAGLADGWFFLRYADPAPQLRVRFHGDPETLLGPLMRQVCEWATELVADGTRTGYAFGTYEREVERYGGEAGVALAEATFVADSPAAAELVGLARDGETAHDAETLAALSIDDLLDALGLSAEERLAVYAAAAPLSKPGGAEYRLRRGDLRRLLGGRRPDDAVTRALAARRAALAPVAPALRSLEREGRLGRPLPDVCRAFVHLHANRLGVGAGEHVVLELLRRTREGLLRAPLSR